MTSSGNALFLPLLAQVLLTLTLYVRLAVAKGQAVRQGRVDEERRALHADAWPENVVAINNNIRNQFEVPVLFYVLILVLHQLDATGWLAQSLAWVFVASRLLHACIHTGSNIVPLRRNVFMLGCVMVLAMLALAFWTLVP